jgi:hypothetical protein
MKSYFWKQIPLNADIERHREKEAELRENIQELENSTDPFDVRALATYRNFLNLLLESKAQITSKIGKK